MAHEHQRPDRDTKLNVINVSPCSDCCTTKNYFKFPSSISNTFGLPYDYCSIMHYSNIPINCQLVPRENVECNIKGEDSDTIGQRKGLSPLDKETIRRRYNCRGGCTFSN